LLSISSARSASSQPKPGKFSNRCSPSAIVIEVRVLCVSKGNSSWSTFYCPSANCSTIIITLRPKIGNWRGESQVAYCSFSLVVSISTANMISLTCYLSDRPTDRPTDRPSHWIVFGTFCYCAYVLRISGYSGFLKNLPTNTTTFLRGL